MKTMKIYCLALLMIIILSACGISPAEQAGTATQAVVNDHATQTALAPTATPTDTATPTATSTPTSTATPTSTPTLTNTPTITPTPVPVWWNAVLTQEDLTEGFLPMGEDELSGLYENMPPGTIAFGYTNEVKTQIIMGFYAPLPTRLDQISFDQVLPDTVVLMASSSGAVNEPKAISGMDDIGDTRYAVTFLIAGGVVDLRVDLTVFRRGEVAAFLFNFYPDGDEPEISAADLAHMLDQRLIDQRSQ